MKQHGSVSLFIWMLLVSVTFPLSVSAQTPDNIPQAAFGEVPDTLLQMEEYGPQPSAPYIYAYNGLDISFEEQRNELFALLRYHIRIKVFDGEAREAAVVGIPYYFADNVEEIRAIRGVTVQPDGEKTALPEDAIRTINANSRYNIKEFEMPDVRQGSVIDYTYEIRRSYIEELPNFDLAQRVPTAISRVTLDYPHYLRYNVMPEHIGDIEPERIVERIDTSSVPKVFSLPRPEPQVLEHWVAYEIPGVEEEPYISSINDYRGRLKFQLSEFGNPRQELENSWKYVVALLRYNQDPWEHIEASRRAREIGREVAGQFDDPVQIQDSLFFYLNETARFDGEEGAFAEPDEQSLLSGEQANKPAINMVMISMLQGAGIEAAPLFTSTRDFGKINQSFPSFFQFNSLLVYSEIDGRSYIMDASYPESKPNLIPSETHSDSGLVVWKDAYEWIEINPSESFFGVLVDLAGRLEPDGDLTGTVFAENEGYAAQVVREKISAGEEADEIIAEALFDGYSQLELEDAQIRHAGNRNEAVYLEAGFRLEDYALSFRDGLEFRPMIVGSLPVNPFESSQRTLPVTLDAPEKLQMSYNIELPYGLEVDTDRGRQSLELPGARLEEFYRSENRELSYNFTIDINRKHYETEEYHQLKELYDRWVEISRGSWNIRRR